MKRYRYNLDPSSKKYKCPNCGQFSLVIFIDSETGEILENYGRCDRESKCGFFYHPSKDGFQNCKSSTVLDHSTYEFFPSFHKNDLVEISMRNDNNLLKYIRFLFGISKAEYSAVNYTTIPRQSAPLIPRQSAPLKCII